MSLSSQWPFSPAVTRAIKRVDRRKFVSKDYLAEADGDYPLPIGHGQTISQPSLVAFMTDELSLFPDSKVLELGTGCGYQTALLAEICSEVYTVEVVPELAESAKERLLSMGYDNIHFSTGDGHLGWPESAPFDGIIVTAAASDMPPALADQLADSARLIIPVGPQEGVQTLYRIERTGDSYDSRKLLDVRFVPLVRG